MSENNLFDMFKDEFSGVEFQPLVIQNEKDGEYLRILREEREKNLSPFAFRTADTRGRLKPEEPCIIRTAFERDMGRIIFSQSFRRLRHKTQVFFNPLNDHICSRIEHVIYVNYIATIIGRALNLNTDLIQAIAMGHDIGHAPFGHSGERALDKCMRTVDPEAFFEHEQQSLRVLDVLEEHSKATTDLTSRLRLETVSYRTAVRLMMKDLCRQSETKRQSPSSIKGRRTERRPPHWKDA